MCFVNLMPFNRLAGRVLCVSTVLEDAYQQGRIAEVPAATASSKTNQSPNI